MEMFFMFFMFFIINGLLYYFVFSLPRKNWNKLHPKTLEQYLQEFPAANTGKGITCGPCGGRSLRNIGFSGINCRKRLVSCNSCSSNLYHAKN